MKSILPHEALLKLYYALFHPHLLYGIVSWGSTFPTFLSRLNSLQNKAVKLIGGGKMRESANAFYIKFNILKLPELYKYETAKLVHSFIHNQLPLSLSNFFTKSCKISKRQTRSHNNPNNLYTPCYRSNRLQRSIKYQGVKIWNAIPPEIQKLPRSSFKTKLKKHFIQLYHSNQY